MNNLIVNAGEFDGIEIEIRHGLLLVDSRLIANRLGIEHETLMNTLKKHQSVMEQDFGVLRFENGKVKNTGRPQKFVYLTEDQATFLMTLSRNSPEVVQCKSSLVKAFSRARQLLSGEPVEPVAPAPTPEPAPRQLSPEFFGAIVNAAEVFGLTEDPLLRSAMTQYMCEIVGSRSASNEQAKQVVLTVRAAELGYSVKDIDGGSQLGTFIVRQGFKPSGKTQHGRYPVNVYQWSEALDRAIHSYFS